MTRTVGVHEAKTHLSRLLEQVAAGEEIEITNRGRVVARLVGPARRRPNFDFDRGRIWIADDFDDDLPEELQRAFEGEE
jgi:prevent-host-death family protein